MSIDYLVSDLALMLVVASIVVLIFKKLKQPVVLGYIVAGFLISPNFTYLPTIIDEADIETLASIGIVFLMFALGLEFSFHKLAKVGGSAIMTSLITMVGMIALGYFIGRILGLSAMDGIFLGGMISMSSTMIILKTFDESGIKGEKFATLILGTLVVEDIAGIFMMIVLSTISVSKNVSGQELALQLGTLLLLLTVWLAAGIFLVPTALKKIEKYLNDEFLVIISVAFCLGMVVIADAIGFSSALGAFMAGSILAGTKMAERIEHLITPIKDLFGGIFFISVGLLIQPEMLVEHIGMILVVAVVTIIGQSTFATLGILLSGQNMETAIRGGMCMVQIGEFSFIVATLGTSLGVISDFLYPVIVCVSVLTTFTTPIFVNNSAKLYNAASGKIPEQLKSRIKGYTSSNKDNDLESGDWKIYLKKYLIRTLLLVSILAGFALVCIHTIEPLMEGYLGPKAGDLVTAGISIAIILPLLTLLNRKDDVLFTKLWIEKTTNRIPLSILHFIRILVSITVLMYIIRATMNMELWLGIVLAVLMVVLGTRTDIMKSASIKLEARFVSNFNARILAKKRKERAHGDGYFWIEDKVFITAFYMNDTPEKHVVKDFYYQKLFSVLFIKIIRGGHHINMPGPNEIILKDDMILAAGTKEEIEAYILMLKNEKKLDVKQGYTMTLREFVNREERLGIKNKDIIFSTAIPIKADTPFVKSTIKESGIKNVYKGFVIGIERGDLPMLAPDINTVIEEDDMLWVLGTYEMADMLVKNNLLNFE